MVTCIATRNLLCSDYIAVARYLGLATGAPGNGTTAANEATGGGYARLAIVWGSVAGGSSTAAQLIMTVDSGTYNYLILANDSTIGGANMVDNASIPPVTANAPGSIIIIPTYAQT